MVDLNKQAMRKNQLHNLLWQKQDRRTLRSDLTPAEAILWKALQRKQLEGRKFRRQHGVGKYILDFYCPSEKLAVEVDGTPHSEYSGYMHDKDRDGYLNNLGIKVVRIDNEAVYSNLEAVLEEIKGHFTTPGPS